LPNSTLASLVQPEKADELISAAASSNTTLVSAVQLENALLPMLVTLDGIVTVTKPVL